MLLRRESLSQKLDWPLPTKLPPRHFAHAVSSHASAHAAAKRRIGAQEFRMLSPLMPSFTRIKVYCESRAGKALLRTRLAKLPSAVSGGNSSESWKGTHRHPATPEDAGSRSTCCLVPGYRRARANRLRSCLRPFGGPAGVFIRDNCFATVDKLGPLLCRKRIHIADVGHLGAAAAQWRDKSSPENRIV
jgi:hypothetical protein